MPISHVLLQDRYRSASSFATLAAASSAVAVAVNSGCSRPRSPAKAQQRQPSGTTTWSATKPASMMSESLTPIRVLEQVGCTTANRALDSDGSFEAAALGSGGGGVHHGGLVDALMLQRDLDALRATDVVTDDQKLKR